MPWVKSDGINVFLGSAGHPSMLVDHAGDQTARTLLSSGKPYLLFLPDL